MLQQRGDSRDESRRRAAAIGILLSQLILPIFPSACSGEAPKLEEGAPAAAARAGEPPPPEPQGKAAQPVDPAALAKASLDQALFAATLEDLQQAVADYSKAIESSPEPILFAKRGLVSLHIFTRTGFKSDLVLAFMDFDEAFKGSPVLHTTRSFRGDVAREELGQAVSAIRFLPDDALTMTLKANILCMLGQYQVAVETAGSILEKDKGPTAWRTRGLIYAAWARQVYNEGRWRDSREIFKKAVSDLNEVLNLSPQDLESLLSRGEVHDSLGELQQPIQEHAAAITDFARAIELDPKNVRAYCGRGNVFKDLSRRTDRTGNLERAMADLTKAITIDSNCGVAYATRGNVYLLLDQNQKAVADSTRAIELMPQDPAAYSVRGSAYVLLGRHKEAVADCSEAIRLNPRLGNPWMMRGGAYLNLARRGEGEDNYGRAFTDLSKAIEINPLDYEAYWLRASVQYDQGRQSAALRDCNQALKIDPNFLNAYLERARVLEAIGRRAEAAADLRKAAQIDPQLKEYLREFARKLGVKLEL